MNCEYEYCIYNENFSCLFKEIDINSLGMCEHCITIDLPKKTLEKLKQKQLHDIMQRNKKDK